MGNCKVFLKLANFITIQPIESKLLIIKEFNISNSSFIINSWDSIKKEELGVKSYTNMFLDGKFQDLDEGLDEQNNRIKQWFKKRLNSKELSFAQTMYIDETAFKASEGWFRSLK